MKDIGKLFLQSKARKTIAWAKEIAESILCTPGPYLKVWRMKADRVPPLAVMLMEDFYQLLLKGGEFVIERTQTADKNHDILRVTRAQGKEEGEK